MPNLNLNRRGTVAGVKHERYAKTMNTMTNLLCTTLAVVLATSIAEARIGATPEECKAAYGIVRETRSDGSKISYRRDGVSGGGTWNLPVKIRGLKPRR